MDTPLQVPSQSAEQRSLVLALAAHLRPMQHAPVMHLSRHGMRRWCFTPAALSRFLYAAVCVIVAAQAPAHGRDVTPVLRVRVVPRVGRMRTRRLTPRQCGGRRCARSSPRLPPGPVLALERHRVAELRVGMAAAATKPAGICGARAVPAPESEPGGSGSAWGSDRVRAASGALPPPLPSPHLQRLEQRSHEGCVRGPPSSPPTTPPAAPGAAIA